MTDIDSLIIKTHTEFENDFSIFFSDKNLIIQALKHRSFLMVTSEVKTKSNERLEFLGDAVLELVMTSFLYKTYPNLPEGDLSKKKSILVSKKVLGAIAAELELGKYILMNRGEEKTGGRTRIKLLANVVESIIGAIYLDKGYDDAKEFIDKYLIANHKEFENDNKLQNYKSELLELVQSHKDIFPVYELIEEIGPDHLKEFVVEVRVLDNVLAKGTGKSKKEAEQLAAKTALSEISSGNLTLSI